MQVRSIDVPVLPGSLVRLEPLGLEHVEGLVAASGENRESYSYTTVPSGREEVGEYARELMSAAAAGDAVPFAQVRVADDEVVGSTRFLTLRRRPGADAPYAVEIGGTWLAASAQRTGLNLEAKLLLLTYAFEEWRVGRVDFKTDARNGGSRAAIAGIGAAFEAVPRSWQPSHASGEAGMLRDSAMYAVVASDWPEVRAALRARLDA